MSDASRLLSKYYIVALLLAMILGGFFTSVGQFFKTSMKWIIAFCIFSVGLTIDLKEIRDVKKMLTKISFGSFISCFLMPTVAYIISWMLFRGDIESKAGLILLSTSIPALSTTVWTTITMGYTLLSTAILLISAVIVTASMPLITYITLGSSVVTEPMAMFGDLLIMLFIPLTTAVAIKRFHGGINPETLEISHIASKLAIILIVFGNVAIVWPKISSVGTDKIWLSLVAVSIYCLSGFSIGFYISKYLFNWDRRTAVTLSYSAGMRDCAITIAVAVTQFTPLTSLPATCYIIIQQLAASATSVIANRAKIL